MWADRIYVKNHSMKNEIDRLLVDIRDHMGQFAAQGSKVVDSATNKQTELGKPNYINAVNELKHLREIATNAEASVNEFFDLAKRVGA
jgi:hypothetical protein